MLKIIPSSDLLGARFTSENLFGTPAVSHVVIVSEGTVVLIHAPERLFVLRNILPHGSNGIQIVFSNPCTESFTYQINGPDVVYNGVGDKHDKKYDGMAHHAKLFELSGMDKTLLYTGALLDKDFCPMTLSYYPSDVMKASFTTHNPQLFTVAVVAIFAFTSLVFILYDVMVELRQKKVLNTAVRSTAIVSSLFPSTVRDRLYPEAALKPETAKGKLQSFLRDNTSADANTGGANFAGNPIAELYPDTTVLFADIVGFTAWSSTRQPTQVFTLLETLYAAFDSIAKQRGVFKVETIGDSYVAVVGLPTPRRHHAVIMATFASDCRSKMSEVTSELEQALGPVRLQRSLESQSHRISTLFCERTLGNWRFGSAMWHKLWSHHGRCSSW
jgi:Adenylate and Guanylate cyclase catalytic domain